MYQPTRLFMSGRASVAVFVVSITIFASTSSAITIETVTVGDPGNPNDPATGRGSVAYQYDIGKYEVTVAEYTAFLNAIAATDPYGLYSPSMATDLNVACIAQAGTSGSYTYSTIGSPNHPVSYVSWGDAVRFTNWLYNGQPTDAEAAGSTETGAYTLNGAVTAPALLAVTRNGASGWYLPNNNEWYKAAYYQPAAKGGDVDSYWKFPTKSNAVPISDQPPGNTIDNTRVANFNFDDGVANGFNDGYAVTGSTIKSTSQNYLTDVGAYTSSPSYYGTFDQGGNVYEWNESLTSDGTQRILRGGFWDDPSASGFAATFVNAGTPSLEFNSRGFRVAFRAPIAGDFNNNGVVDAADYVLWRNGGPLANETSPPGIVDQADYDAWRAAFGNNTPSSGALLAESTVPEPAAIALIVLGSLLMMPQLRRLASSSRCTR
jgi:formylglycine-generating enzyme